MSKLKLYREAEGNVPTGGTHAGKIYFTSERNLYVIDTAGNKIKFSDVIFETNEAAISGLTTKYQGKIYIALAEATMWFWTGSGLTQLGANNLYAKRLLSMRNISTSNHTLQASDIHCVLACTSSSAQDIYLEENSTVAIPIGFKTKVTQLNTGTVNITGIGSVVVLGASTIAFQYGVATLIKIDTDTWLISGDVA